MDLRSERRAAQKAKAEAAGDESKASHIDINDEDLITKAPTDGVYIYGLYIESGACRNVKKYFA